MASKWLTEARAAKSRARKNKSQQVFLQPIYKGKRLILEYRNLKLRIKGFGPKTIELLRHSDVPRFLNNPTYANWGGSIPPVLFVSGKVITSRRNEDKKYFVVEEIRGGNGEEYHNQIATMNLAFARGFFTMLAESSWMNVDEVTPQNLKKRLKAKAELRIETQRGRAFLPPPPIGLKLYDCMAWKAPVKKKVKK